MFLVYDEKHEQAKWVLHKISTNILEGILVELMILEKIPLLKQVFWRKRLFLKTKKKMENMLMKGLVMIVDI